LIRDRLAGSIVCVRFFRREHRKKELGQAAVELMVALPVVLFVLTAGWQIVLAGHAWWTLNEAARIAARTAYVAAEGDKSRLATKQVVVATDRSAIAALPRQMRTGHITRIAATGTVSVSAAIPLAAPFAAVAGRAPRITARSGIAQ
jgi:hypothetical protein